MVGLWLENGKIISTVAKNGFAFGHVSAALDSYIFGKFSEKMNCIANYILFTLLQMSLHFQSTILNRCLLKGIIQNAAILGSFQRWIWPCYSLPKELNRWLKNNAIGNLFGDRVPTHGSLSQFCLLVLLMKCNA